MRTSQPLPGSDPARRRRIIEQLDRIKECRDLFEMVNGNQAATVEANP